MSAPEARRAEALRPFCRSMRQSVSLPVEELCLLERRRRALTSSTDPELMVPWTMKAGAHEIFTLPRITAIRSFVMNHVIHHRGQLSVYLRLKDVPLPSIYGPTADEQ